jgi:hypothetical protein
MQSSGVATALQYISKTPIYFPYIFSQKCSFQEYCRSGMGILNKHCRETAVLMNNASSRVCRFLKAGFKNQFFG